MSNSRKTPRLAAAIAVAACMVMAFAALGGVGLAQTSGGPGGKQYGKKVTICHKGKKTIKISKKAWPAHQRHGDTLGSCAKKAKKAKAKAEKAKAEKAETAEKSESEERSGKGGDKGKGKEKGKGK